MAIVRIEEDADIETVQKIIELAFQRTDEADLVEDLRQRSCAILSLVALRRGEIVGHLFFTRVIITNGMGFDRAVGMAPLSVQPAHRRTGVGTDLVRHGIASLKNRGRGVLVVLGDPAYYRRFGFQPAATFGLTTDFTVPADHFMALPLDSNRVEGCGGMVKYAPPFYRLGAQER